MLITSLTWAVPACPGGADVRQPDGTIVTVLLRGDERAHWHEDANGYAVMKSPVSGFWVFGRENGGVIRPTDFILGRYNPVQLGLSRPSPARIKAAGLVRQPAVGMEALSPAPQPPTGTMRNLVVLVSFSDLAVDYPRQDYDDLFNQVGHTADGAVGSVKDYYHEVSYNNLTVQSTVVEAVTLDNGYAYYGANSGGFDIRPREMVAEALAKLEARGFDFSTVDGNSDSWTDGWVDGLTIIHAGGGEEYGGNDPDYIWSHQWSLISTVTYDGVGMRTYHTEPARRGRDSSPSTWGITRIGVICHENGHFLGLPDLYDYGYDSSGVGDFCLMAGGSWNGDSGTTPAQMSAWCKTDLGWVTPTVISADGSYTLLQVETNAQVYKLQGSFAAHEYFLVENRQGIGFDAGIPGPSRGILIWHVDENQPNNDDQTHYKVDLEEAGSTQHLELNLNNGEDSDYYRAGNATIFSNISMPDNKSYTGIDLGLNISNISTSGASMSFDVSSTSIVLDLFYSQNLDTNPGWTMMGEWQFGQPTGGGGVSYGNPDPTSGATGTNVYGVNLSGDYSLTVGGPYYLTTGPVNCASYQNIQVQFQRWLNTDYQPYVSATLEVSNDGTTWIPVWDNGTGSDITDSSWIQCKYNVSFVADQQSMVYFRWGYQISSEAYAYSGWNIDDIELWGQTDPIPTASDGAASTCQESSVTVTLSVVDDGLPDTPAALTYFIDTLPADGILEDPGAGLITEPNTPLVGNGNQVVYTPDQDFSGEDMFTFKANDGGQPSEGGGDSNIADIIIEVEAAPPAATDPNPNDHAVEVPIDTKLSWSYVENTGTLVDLITNGGFETGDFSGWVLMDSTNGGFVINDGTLDPDGPEVPVSPYSGSYSVVVIQAGIGTNTLYQEITLPTDAASISVSWIDRIRNHNAAFNDPGQEFRVELWDTSNQVLTTLFSTNPGDTLLQNWTPRSVDITTYAGQTVRLAFTEQDSLNYFNVHLDDVQVEVVPLPATFDVYFGTDNPPVTLIDSDLIAPNTNPGLLDFNTQYYWQVVVKQDCIRYGEIWTFTTGCFVEAPVLHPEPVLTPGLCNTISWNPVYANDYFMECAEDPDFDVIKANSGWTQDLNTTFCNLTSGQQYWYRVKARMAGDCESQWSNVESSRQCGTPGDFEPDCDVDVIDLAFLLSHWLESGCDDSAGDESDWCYGADLNKDGEVDLGDVQVLGFHWQEDLGP